MIRLSTASGERLETARRLDCFTGGAESNVAVALARLGLRTAWFSSLPNTPPGLRIERDISQQGVDTSNVIRTDTGRAGEYFVEFNSPPLPTRVIYDRENSAFSQISPEEIDWDAFLDTRLIHLTGITPALSSRCRDLVEAIIERASSRGIPISFDVNYRSLLWNSEKAATTLEPLLQKATIIISTKEDAKELFDLTGKNDQVLDRLHQRFGASVTVLTLGAKGAIGTNGSKIFRASGYEVHPVDPIGAGDAFAAGILYGYLQNDLELGFSYGTAMSAIKMGICGDRFIAGKKDIEKLLVLKARKIER